MIVDCGLYRHGQRVPGHHEPAAACALTVEDDDSFVWVGIADPVGEGLTEIAEAFALPKLAVEDAMEAHQRPKFEVYGDVLFVAVKPVRYVDTEEVVRVDEVQIFVHKRYIVTVRHGAATALGEVRRELEAAPELLRHGPVAALHAILDRIVDDYDDVVDGVDQDIQEVEQQVFSGERGGPNPAERIFKLEREVLEFQRAVGPLTPAVDRLARGQLAEAVPEVSEYFRDVHDHLLRISGRLDTIRDTIATAIQVTLSMVTIEENDINKKLAAYAAIFAVFTAFAGIWGMNFEFMPELKWKYGYPTAVGIMFGAGGYLYYRFKKSGWL